VVARVHLVYLMNVQQRQVAAKPQTKPTGLGLFESDYWLPTIAI